MTLFSFICLLVCGCIHPVQGAIYDCFLFFNELDILEIRLHELDDYVDYFVLVESVETFKGKPKPLFFLENQERFAPFASKIIHVILDKPSTHVTYWDREHYQRNQIIRGLSHCQDKDLVLISDVDEIPRGILIPEAARSIQQGEAELVTFVQDMRRFFFNVSYELSPFTQPPTWAGSVMSSFSILFQTSPQHLRDIRGDGMFLHKGGWHFSSMGGKASVIYKEQSFSHTPSECGASHIFFEAEEKPVRPLKKQRVKRGRSKGYLYLAPMEEMPTFVINNRQLFEEKGFFKN